MDNSKFEAVAYYQKVITGNGKETHVPDSFLGVLPMTVIASNGVKFFKCTLAKDNRYYRPWGIKGEIVSTDLDYLAIGVKSYKTLEDALSS